MRSISGTSSVLLNAGLFLGLACVALAPLHLFAQVAPQSPSVTITGHVQDSVTAASLSGATVQTADHEHGTATNQSGFYRLDVPEDSVTLRFSYVGYQDYQVELAAVQDTTINVDLVPVVGALQELEVKGVRSASPEGDVSTVRLSSAEIKAMPMLLGEPDVLKSMQLLPGVQSGREGSAGLHVRGGGADQNLILFDGMPIYNASHLFGFFSSFNVDAVESATLIKGGFPARYGGRLSSVVDIQPRRGNMEQLKGQGAIGLISSRLTLEGPVLPEKASVLVSARRTYVDVFTRLLSSPNVQLHPYFYDVYGRGDYMLSERSHLQFSLYRGRDSFLRERISDYTARAEEERGNYEKHTSTALGWTNGLGLLRWSYLAGSNLSMHATAGFVQYDLGMDQSVRESFPDEDGTLRQQITEVAYDSRVLDHRAAFDVYWQPRAGHRVRMGLSGTRHRYQPSTSRAHSSSESIRDTTFSPSGASQSVELAAYAEDDMRLGPLQLNAGLRSTGYLAQGRWFTSLQPRISASLLVAGTRWKASYTRMQQQVHQLTNYGIGLPSELWLPATPRARPERAEQVALGFSRSFQDNTLQVSGEIYYKRLRDLIAYKNGASFSSASEAGWEDVIETGGRGTSYGSELFIRKERGRLTGWIGYTLSKTSRLFENLNGGQAFPYRYDRRHDLSLTFRYQLSENTEFTGSWVYGTGDAVTLPVGEYVGVDHAIHRPDLTRVIHYGARNEARMPAYHRLDLGIHFRNDTSWGESTWSLGVYNAYSRRNPYYLDVNSGATWRRGELVADNKSLKQVSLFPILPFVRYSFTF